MIQDNINPDSNLEGGVVESGPKPFDPKDEARKAELEAKFGDKKSVGQVDGAKEAVQENTKIDVVALNNRIVRIEAGMKGDKEKMEALSKLSPEEITAVGEYIANNNDEFDNTYSTLKNFGFKSEIMEQPVIIEALRKSLTKGIHIYNVDRILSILPESGKGILSDPLVKAGLIKSSIKAMGTDDRSALKYMLPIIEKAGLSNEDLHAIAEELKGNNDRFATFVTHFGVKNLYPEVR